MNRTAKAENQISSLAHRYGATPEGTLWMKNALDPFPDERREIVGYPDTVKTPSIVQVFREQIVVTAPGAVDWDCNIFHPGFFGDTQLRSTTAESDAIFIVTGQGANNSSGPVEVRSDTSGVALTEAKNTGRITPQVSCTSMPYRIVAQAIEVHNTTQELNKQGAVISWRQRPIIDENASANLGDTLTTKLSPVGLTVFSDVPNTAAQALLLEGSEEWKASEGGYVVGILSDPDLPPRIAATSARTCVPMMISNSVRYLPTLTAGTNSTTAASCVPKSGYDQYGLFFSGLSPETSLQVVYHYIIERFPGYTDTDLITMARPSIAYDPKALEIYTILAAKLPTGVEVAENFLGSFFTGIANVAGPLIRGLIGASDDSEKRVSVEQARAAENRAALAEQRLEIERQNAAAQVQREQLARLPPPNFNAWNLASLPPPIQQALLPPPLRAQQVSLPPRQKKPKKAKKKNPRNPNVGIVQPTRTIRNNTNRMFEPNPYMIMKRPPFSGSFRY